MKSHVKLMTEGKPVRLIVTFAFPLMIGNIFQQMYSVADSMIVGKTFGVAALAALGASTWPNWIFLGVVMGLSQGVSITLAHSFGRGDESRLRKGFGNSIVLCAGFAVCLLAAGELLAAHDVNEPTPEELQAINDKARESHAFQEKKIAERQQARRSSVHKVKSGESLSSIAKKHHTTVKKLCKLNRISEKTVLRPGQILRYS